MIQLDDRIGRKGSGDNLPPIQKPLRMTRRPADLDLTTFSGRFAARLRMLREKTGMTGVEMADAIRAAGYPLGERSYYNWEAGRNDPPLDALPVLARCLGLKKVRVILPDETIS